MPIRPSFENIPAIQAQAFAAGRGRAAEAQFREEAQARADVRRSRIQGELDILKITKAAEAQNRSIAAQEINTILRIQAQKNLAKQRDKQITKRQEELREINDAERQQNMEVARKNTLDNFAQNQDVDAFATSRDARDAENFQGFEYMPQQKQRSENLLRQTRAIIENPDISTAEAAPILADLARRFGAITPTQRIVPIEEQYKEDTFIDEFGNRHTRSIRNNARTWKTERYRDTREGQDAAAADDLKKGQVDATETLRVESQKRVDKLINQRNAAVLKKMSEKNPATATETLEGVNFTLQEAAALINPIFEQLIQEAQSGLGGQGAGAMQGSQPPPQGLLGETNEQLAARQPQIPGGGQQAQPTAVPGILGETNEQLAARLSKIPGGAPPVETATPPTDVRGVRQSVLVKQQEAQQNVPTVEQATPEWLKNLFAIDERLQPQKAKVLEGIFEQFYKKTVGSRDEAKVRRLFSQLTAQEQADMVRVLKAQGFLDSGGR